MVRDGKCCRRFVACSTASAASPSIIRPSKFSSSNACTASDKFRTICVSKSSISSRIASARSWKTRSAFMVRSLVSTIAKQVEKLIAGTLPTLSVPARHVLLPPAFPRRRLRKVLGSNRVCRPKMDLCHLPKSVRPLLFNDLFTSSFYRRRTPPLQSYTQLFSFPVEPVNEGLTGQNRRRRHRNVRFGARPLLDGDLLPMTKQRLFHPPRIRELVGQRARAVRFFGQQVFDHPGVTPGEQFVQIAEFLIQLVIFRWTNQHDFDQTHRILSNRICQRDNPGIRPDTVAVLHPGLNQFSRDPVVYIDARDHERSEKIALSAFVHAEMRLEHFRRVHFLIAELRLAQNFRLQLELHEFFYALALHKHLWAFLINRHAQFIFLTKKNRVFLRRKFETELIQKRTKCFHLVEV